MPRKKVPLPVNLDPELLDRVDKCRALKAKTAGVPVSRTTFVEKALGDLCSYIEDEAIRHELAAGRPLAGPGEPF